MRNDKFWNECHKGTIRQKVAEFIDESPSLSKLKGKKYYDLEDELVAFIEENKQLISAEVDKEYQRDDIKTRAVRKLGEDVKKIFNVLPIDVIDDIVDCWQECLMDDESEYWDVYWGMLDDTLTDGGICPMFAGIDNYEAKDVKTYIAYIECWYKDHLSRNEDPVCIDEFFDNEALDDELLKHYIEKSKGLFGKGDGGKAGTEKK